MQPQGGDKDWREETYLLNEVEFAVALALWNDEKAYFCVRLDALLPPPRSPVSTPVIYAKYDIFVDPVTSHKYAKDKAGDFRSITNGEQDPQPSKYAGVASAEIVARLIFVEDFPKLTKKAFSV